MNTTTETMESRKANSRDSRREAARPAVHYDSEGRIRVKNLSAWWLPEFTLSRTIGGTVYSVSGTYGGTGTLDRKLKRILGQTLSRETGADL